MIKPENLTALERRALVSAVQTPTHTLTRTRAGFVPLDPVYNRPAFTYRLMRMLDRAYLVQFDDPAFPSRATLTSQGLAIATQLLAAEPAQAVVA